MDPFPSVHVCSRSRVNALSSWPWCESVNTTAADVRLSVFRIIGWRESLPPSDELQQLASRFVSVRQNSLAFFAVDLNLSDLWSLRVSLLLFNRLFCHNDLNLCGFVVSYWGWFLSAAEWCLRCFRFFLLAISSLCSLESPCTSFVSHCGHILSLWCWFGSILCVCVYLCLFAVEFCPLILLSLQSDFCLFVVGLSLFLHHL